MFLEIKQLSKSFQNDLIVDRLSLSLDQHRTLSILGKSGCGKTTLLKLIAGLETADQGSIRVNGEDMSGKTPAERKIVYLYQEDLLFPHLNVRGNIGFGLKLQKIPASGIKEQVDLMIQRLELQGQGDKMPHQLSGGQRQRVSFGRAIITNPRLLLLDEPFGSLDVGTRQRMQELFKELTAFYGITSLFVTHDLKEAILMGDDIGLMKKGSLQIYPDKQDFLLDPLTGVRSEIEFWESLLKPNY
ncbi:ABC transporter ATP-binding protein [Algoriphagus litoralis]|uniref:ABC transporter ATP-binding protein n=1 Tax=Algoriphagus litoralis TaxID=2202829 RepID=UPI000DBAD191|nr:ABC transporter ATP-binding protein [Algoriphagus litoralis]